jgi:hypothetical protein
MKVVLSCDGQGMRMWNFSDEIQKPRVPIGVAPSCSTLRSTTFTTGTTSSSSAHAIGATPSRTTSATTTNASRTTSWYKLLGQR